MNGQKNYVIISTVRDEEQYIENTIRSVIAQTILPIRYVIVNDGSSDKTGSIIDEYARKYPWISAVHRADRGFRNSAGGEVDAFYEGYKMLTGAAWDFIVKLDGDLSFDRGYFEQCISYFNAEEDLGMGGGDIYNLEHDKLELEREPQFHVRGAVKMYSRECWEALRGMYAINGWDTLDEVKANMLGWKTRSFTDLKIIQHRPTGRAVGNWKNAVKNGVGGYTAGYHPLYMVSKCLKRLFHKPYIVESAGLMYGFLKGYLTRMPQVEDRNLVRYLRRQQLNRLLLKPTIWK
jgi:glycosyltransferase involved in cell wall biosynthesis